MLMDLVKFVLKWVKSVTGCLLYLFHLYLLTWHLLFQLWFRPDYTTHPVGHDHRRLLHVDQHLRHQPDPSPTIPDRADREDGCKVRFGLAIVEGRLTSNSRSRFNEALDDLTSTAQKCGNFEARICTHWTDNFIFLKIFLVKSLEMMPKIDWH